MLLTPFPLTETEVALALDHEIVEEPGAVQLPGVALIDALTELGVLTVKVAVCVAGPPLPCAVIVYV